MSACICSTCGTEFRCGIDDAEGCWCARLPALPATALDLDARVACRCQNCLIAALERAASQAAAC
jgi:hypothetical protein